jgi:hypothetical protein
VPDFDLILQAKTKQIQIKLLGFPWIPLAESGLFNGLQLVQIKNFLSLGPALLTRMFARRSERPLMRFIPRSLRALDPGATGVGAKAIPFRVS